MEKTLKIVNKQRVLLFTLLIFLVMSIVNKKFLSGNNIYGMLISLPAYGMCAMGLCVSLISGELNISMGSIMAFSGVLFAQMVPLFGIIPALLIVLLSCAIWGVLGGFFVAYLKIDSFVVTLSLMTLIQGVALLLSNQKPIIIQDAFTINFGILKVGPIPVMAMLFLLFVLFTEYILRHTVFGRNLYAVGANKEIARSIGINVAYHKMLSFIIFSIYSGIGGYFLAARMNTGSPVSGADAPLSVIPMVIIGGTALSGGKGGALKTLLGVSLLQIVFNSMSLYSITASMQLLVKGLIVIIIVVWDKYTANKGRKV